MRWHVVAQTDRGRVRPRNEDALLAHPAAQIYAVADGMGGHAAGDIASRLAIAALESACVRPPAPNMLAPALTRRLLNAFETANESILAHARAHRETSGMGTTLTALSPLRARPQAVVAHVGDSRAYRLRAGELQQLTRDHTWVQQQVDAGMLTPLQARHHRLSSVLSRVLGTTAVGPADTFVVDVAPGDLYLLCSDGLTTMVEDVDLAAMLQRPVSLEQQARDLIDAANLRGGHDNVTILLLAPEPA